MRENSGLSVVPGFADRPANPVAEALAIELVASYRWIIPSTEATRWNELVLVPLLGRKRERLSSPPGIVRAKISTHFARAGLREGRNADFYIRRKYSRLIICGVSPEGYRHMRELTLACCRAWHAFRMAAMDAFYGLR